MKSFSENGGIVGETKGGGGGIRISAGTGFVLVLLATAVAVGVGVIVHFAENRAIECTFPDSAVVVNAGGQTGQQQGQGLVASTTKAPKPSTGRPSKSPTPASAVPPSTAPSTPDTSSVTSTPTPAPQADDIRLPKSFEPVHYNLKLKPNMYGVDPTTFTFDGSVKIFMKCLAASSNVTLHIKALNITEGTIKFTSTPGANSPSFTSYSVDERRQFLIAHLNGETTPGAEYTLSMDFAGPLKNDLGGLYLSSYKRGNETIYLATTQFESTNARKAFPCFDEPQLKATFNVSLVRKANLKSLSNMPQIPTAQRRQDGFVVDVYEQSRKMSTYLLAFIVCDFEYTEGRTNRGTRYRAYATQDAVNQTRVALDAGVKIISRYEDYFGINFPLPKQDMIAIPDFSAGAMENWGLITYRETSMLYQEGVSSASNRQRVQVVVAHELAHQWFGDLVTMEWWDDLWLNEGFAAFVEYMGVDFISPEYKMFEQFVFDLHEVFKIDALVSSHPVFVPVMDPKEIDEIFDTISYNKGASVVRMMRFFLGEETFRQGLQIYLNSRKYSNADHNDLWAALQTQADTEKKVLDVQYIMDTWITQMNYPVVMVTKSANGKVKLTQNRFLSSADAKDPMTYVSTYEYKWQIPFTYTTKNNPNFNQTDKDVEWLTTDERELDVTYPTNAWIVGNIQQYGIYRVNYEEANWKLLAQQLNTDHNVIHVINRAQIINDAFGLASANQLSMDIALSTLDYLESEQEYVPWSTASSELGYIEDMLAETETFGLFQRFLRNKVEKQYARLGLNDTDDAPLQSYLRSSIASIACRSGNKVCIEAAKSLFQQYKDHPDSNPISPNLKTTVYCTAVREGGEDEWTFVFDQYMAATVAAERSRLRRALACTKQVWLINKLMNMAMDFNIIRRQDADYMYIYLSYDPIGRSQTWDYFRANFDKFMEVYGSDSFAMTNIIEGITGSFSTELRLEQLKDFQKLHPNMGTGTRAFAQAIEKTQVNINWMKKYYTIVQQWLTKSVSAN